MKYILMAIICHTNKQLIHDDLTGQSLKCLCALGSQAG